MAKIAIDAMTAEAGVETLVKAVKKIREETIDLEFLLVGDQTCDALQNLPPGIEVGNACLTITGEDSLKQIIGKLKKSSTYNTAKAVAEGKADAGVSFGNTKAVAISVEKNLNPIPGIRKVPLAIKLPVIRDNELTYVIFLDVGSTGLDDCTAKVITQFAVLGEQYAISEGKETSRVGILSNGTEEKKGTFVTKDANKILKQYSNNGMMEYVGFVEGRDIFTGTENMPDIIVTDGHTGNVCLKIMEGLALLFKYASKKAYTQNPIAIMAGGLTRLSGAKEYLTQTLNPDIHGGASFLGLEKPFIKGHGNANEVAMKAAIQIAYRATQADNSYRLEKSIQRLEKTIIEMKGNPKITFNTNFS